ncbi:MAG: family 20 glycosylhydrolase [Planctomycetota bacterium]|nr:family 20 glycosylhydrolase [Planctomycetota bacterium]
MSKRLMVAAALVLVLSAAAMARDAQFNFVPWPQSVKAQSGTLTLTASSKIVAAEASLKPLAQVLSGEIYMMSGLRLATGTGAGAAGDIVLALDAAMKKPAAYTVAVTDRVAVTGGAYVGAAHGTSLLLQALQPGKGALHVPRLAVEDAPYSEYYGAMVDIARQNNSLEELRGVVDMMRVYRLRFLQLHMSDDQAWTFPSKAYPQLGKSNWATRGGPVPKVYTADQWKELVRYADERGVTFVPEIETPGHSGAARRDLPEVFGPDVAVMNMTNPKMYDGLDTILGEVADVFASSPYIHIGCDECNIEPISRDANSKAFREANGLKDGNDLFAWHIAKVAGLVKKHGKKTIVWQDAPITDRVPKDVIVMVWHIDGNNGATADYVKQGHPVIQVTWTPCVYQPVKDVYEWNAWQKEWPEGGPMLGAQMVLWELSGRSAVPFLRYKAAPRGERVWNPYTGLPYADFARRLEAADAMLDLATCGIVVEEKGLMHTLHDWLAEGGKGDEGSGILPKFAFGESSTVTLKTPVPGAVVRYTTDGEDPTAQSPACTGAVKLHPGKDNKMTLKARLFDAEGKPAGAPWSREYYRKPVAGVVTGPVASGDRIAEPVTVTLKAAMKGAIRYTMNGSAPTVASPSYTSPIKVDKTATVVAALFVADKQVGESWKQTFNWVAVVKSLTTGKPVTTSATEGGYAAENAVDGVVERDRAWWAGPYPQWLQVDLQAPHKINKIEVFPFWDGGRVYQYKVELSLDGKTWTQVVDMSKNAKPAVAEGDSHTFAPTSGRYVRITILKNSANVGVHLVELRAFEAK